MNDEKETTYKETMKETMEKRKRKLQDVTYHATTDDFKIWKRMMDKKTKSIPIIEREIDIEDAIENIQFNVESIRITYRDITNLIKDCYEKLILKEKEIPQKQNLKEKLEFNLRDIRNWEGLNDIIKKQPVNVEIEKTTKEKKEFITRTIQFWEEENERIKKQIESGITEIEVPNTLKYVKFFLDGMDKKELEWYRMAKTAIRILENNLG